MPTERNLAQEHEDNDRRYSYDFDTRLRRYMLRAFSPLLSGKRRALELGCYLGDMTALLVERFDDVTVVEGAPDLAQAVRSRFGKRIRVHSALFEQLQLGSDYDAIFLVHTLEHLDDPTRVLELCRKWLAPGGLLFVVVPNANAPSRQIAVKMGLIESNAAITDAEFKHGHRRTYSLDTLERDTRKSGLQVVHRGGIFFKALANFQFDRLLSMNEEIVGEAYLDACYELGMQYPDLCASVFNVCATQGRS